MSDLKPLAQTIFEQTVDGVYMLRAVRATSGRARAAGFDAADLFRGSDSYSLFAWLGDAVMTGPTGNNLRDLRILIHE